MKIRIFLAILIVIAVGILTGCKDKASQGVEDNETKSINVFAASSTTDVIKEIVGKCQISKGVEIKLNLAASGVLARQIESGAPADVFISANQKWIEYLDEKQLLKSETKGAFIKNELVLIANNDFIGSVTITPDFDIAGAYEGRMAIGDPEFVPAGKYAKEALENLGWWQKIESDRIVKATNVRAALNFVETGQCPLGIVYKTDALVSNNSKIIAVFPEQLHKPVNYYLAVCSGAGEAADEFLEYVKSTEASVIYEKAGFEPLK
ncbi:MAG: molybdate ABC transporter substrate-binding protein [Sedimentisphaeraceae bacterium JB056]